MQPYESYARELHCQSRLLVDLSNRCTTTTTLWLFVTGGSGRGGGGGGGGGGVYIQAQRVHVCWNIDERDVSMSMSMSASHVLSKYLRERVAMRSAATRPALKMHRDQESCFVLHPWEREGRRRGGERKERIRRKRKVPTSCLSPSSSPPPFPLPNAVP